MGGDPFAFADALGIAIHCSGEVPFRVGSGEDFVIFLWSPNPVVRESRAWEGVAQCVLTRAGIAWSEAQAADFAKKISSDRAPEKFAGSA